MLLGLRRFVQAPWMPIVVPLFAFWGFLFLYRADQDIKQLPPPPERNDKNIHETGSSTDEDAADSSNTHDVSDDTNEAASSTDEDTADSCNTHDASENFPPTEEQLEEKIENFIDSIDEDAVCRLASQHNDHKPCTVIDRDRGSFNVCFFVRFDDDDTKWVVRIPLAPVVHNAWDKVQSEVATMKYIERNTTIPVPHVHTYGECTELMKAGSAARAFLIYDFIVGQPLNIRMLAKAEKNQRENFYHDLIDVFAQLRKLEFSAAGSLMPDPDKESEEPIVGHLLSMAANELQRCYRKQGGPNTFSTEKEFLDYQYHILSETYRLPTEELDSEQVQMEFFALDTLASQIPNLIDPQRPDGPFVLAHPDLRCGDIMVAEDFRIRGIIDWEFACTIPRNLFTPPPWITGQHAVAAAAMPRIYADFHHVLEAKAAAYRDCADLQRDWESVPELMLPMAQIFRRPSSLEHIFYSFIFPKLFKGDRRKVVPEFFDREDIANTLGIEAQDRMEKSALYTQYLKDHGLLVDDE